MASGDIAVASTGEGHSRQESYSKNRGYLGHLAKQTIEESLTQKGGVLTASGSVTLDSQSGNIALQGGKIDAGKDVTLRANASLSAGLSSLSSQATIALINNGGDISAALKDLGSQDFIRSLATSMITAGLTSGLSNALGVTGKAVNWTDSDLLNRALGQAMKESVRSGVGVVAGVINGEKPAEALANGLRSIAAGTIGAIAAQEIGLAYRQATLEGNDPLTYVAHKMAHAALGCATGAISGGECAGGAIGGAVGEIAGGLYFSQKAQDDLAKDIERMVRDEGASPEEIVAFAEKWRQEGVDLSRLAGAFAAFMTGTDINTADATATNAVENNGGRLAVALITAGTIASYAAIEGDGDAFEGVRKMGRGDDTLTEAVRQGDAITDDMLEEYFPGGKDGYELLKKNLIGAVNPASNINNLLISVFGIDLGTMTADATIGALARSDIWQSLPQDDKDLILGYVRIAEIVIIVETGRSVVSAGGGSVGGGATTQVLARDTRFIDGVTVTDRATGNVFKGTVDLQPTLDRIASGAKYAHKNDGTPFRNDPSKLTGKVELPVKPYGYYTEYVHPTSGIKGPGPQRIIVGQGGEMYYTPNHYDTFVQIR